MSPPGEAFNAIETLMGSFHCNACLIHSQTMYCSSGKESLQVTQGALMHLLMDVEAMISSSCSVNSLLSLG